MNERHALDKTAFSCISLFAGAFTNACRMHAGTCTLSKFVKRIYGVPNACAFIQFFWWCIRECVPLSNRLLISI